MNLERPRKYLTVDNRVHNACTNKNSSVMSQTQISRQAVDRIPSTAMEFDGLQNTVTLTVWTTWHS